MRAWQPARANQAARLGNALRFMERNGTPASVREGIKKGAGLLRPPFGSIGCEADQKLRLTPSVQVRGRAGTPLTIPSEVETSLIVVK